MNFYHLYAQESNVMREILNRVILLAKEELVFFPLLGKTQGSPSTFHSLFHVP